jgi:dnd system-associated protein 4
MSIRRVYIAEDKAELVRSLRSAENPTAPFQTYADVMTFAAVLGAKRGKKISLGKTSRKEPDPIPQDQFLARGYEPVINNCDRPY